MSNQTMRALLQTAYGDPSSVLQLTTVPIPTLDPSSSSILLKVKAASINPLDYLLARGGLKFVWEDPMPAPVGADFSGVVVQAGEGSGFKEGDEVFGCTSMQARGSFAEYCIVRGANCIPKPGNMTHEEAACLGVVGITAIQAFQRHQGPRETAFIPAGMGGVGHIALQLAKPYAGFKRTITTVSSSKVGLVKEHVKDVDEVIDYTSTNPEDAIPAGSVDFVLEQFGKPASYVRYMRRPPSSSSSEEKPSIISIATPWYIRQVLTAMDWWTRLWIPSWVKYDSFFAVVDERTKGVLGSMAQSGRVRPYISKIFPLEEAVEAIAYAETKPPGKVVIRMGE